MLSTRPKDALSRARAVPLAVGSIAGSGVLFLPSAVYLEAGTDSVWVWLLATLMCVPMLLIFEDAVRHAPDGQAMQWLITTGLGRRLGDCVPALFASIVVIGLPAGAMVAGRYVAAATGVGHGVAAAVAAVILGGAVAANLAGAATNAAVQTIATWLLVVVIGALTVGALGSAHAGRLRGLVPDGVHLGVVLPAVVLAFWAFAGFENLTFLSDQLRRPERDLLPVCTIALVLYGGLTVALTVAIAAGVPRNDVDQLTGLLQIVGHGRWAIGVTLCVVSTAVAAIGMNAVAWTWGVARLTSRAAAEGLLPAGMSRITARGVPCRATLALAGMFAVTTAALTVWPQLVVDAVAAAGSVFLLLYTFCIVAYVRVRGLTARSVANLVLLLVIVPTLTTAGRAALYGPAVVGLVLLARWQVTRRRANERA